MSIHKSILWFSFGSVIYLGTQWIMTVLVTRGSGLNDAGILSLATSISATFQTIALFGIRNYQVSDIKEKYSDSLYIQSRFITCFVALLSCVFFILFSRYQTNSSIAIFLFMIFRISDAFSDVFHGVLQKNNRFDLIGKGYIYKGFTILVFFAIGYYCCGSLNVGLLFFSAGIILVTLLYDMKNAKNFILGKISFQSKAECVMLLKETAPLCICVCLQSAILTAPKYILEKLCDEVALGAYSVIFAPATLLQVAASYIFTPFTGRFSQLYMNHETLGFKRLFLQICSCITLIGAISVPCAKFIAWKLLNFIFGAVISDYEFLLIPIMFCTFAIALFSFCNMLCVVIRDFKGQVTSSILGFAVCIISTVFCILNFGMNGASYGLFIGITIAIIIMVVRINKIISRAEYGEGES